MNGTRTAGMKGAGGIDEMIDLFVEFDEEEEAKKRALEGRKGKSHKELLAVTATLDAENMRLRKQLVSKAVVCDGVDGGVCSRSFLVPLPFCFNFPQGSEIYSCA